MYKYYMTLLAVFSIKTFAATCSTYPEWATTIENKYIPLICNTHACITKGNTQDPYDSNFYTQIQSVDNLWISESAALLAKDPLHPETNRDFISNYYDINISSTETLAAIYELEQIKEDNFFIDNKEDYKVKVGPNRLQICEYIKCNGNLPLQVKATLELRLPK